LISIARMVRRLGMMLAVVGVAGVAAWLARAGGASGLQPHVAPQAEPGPPPALRPLAVPPDAPALLSPPAVPPAPFATLARAWTFAHALSGDRVPVRAISQAPAGIVVDASSGRVLWSKNARTPLQIASLTKMMTMLLAVEALQRGEVRLDTPIIVSRAAANVGGSQVYLKQGETFTLSELLKTIIIASANDSSHAVAEALGGNVDTFVQRMNARATALGMNATRYYNPHGLPMPSGRNVASALDVALLARQLLKFPLVLQWSSTWMDTFRGGTFTLHNHNRLVKSIPGCDGLKTGYYSAAGYSNAVTVQRGSTRLIVVVLGVKSRVTRDEIAKELTEWGFRQSAMLAAQ